MSKSATKSFPEQITFLRKRDYRFIRALGAGACGQTVLLYDDIIEKHFVCKKYQPYHESFRKELFDGFLREIKLLHQLHHKNVVRVFNYYVYPTDMIGYILMEHIDGVDIQTHISKKPEHLNDLFLQAVSGFQYMEENGILHRDIRPWNLLVTTSGDLKIIDLGFGKAVASSADFGKSISLNWWCDVPDEFTSGKYDFKTEVYFVGKLFEKLIGEASFESFNQKNLLRKMCMRNPDDRIASFAEVAKECRSEEVSDVEFSKSQVEAYRRFATILSQVIERIEHGARYLDDIDRIKRQLADAYRSFMLETIVPDAVIVTQCLIEGGYFYQKNGFSVAVVKDFIDLLRGCSVEQSRIVLANLQTKMDAIPRYSKEKLAMDDIPF